MSGLVFFDDEANNEVIQEWMSNDTAALTASSNAVDIFEATDVSSSKGGLGFSNDKGNNNQGVLKDNNRNTDNKKIAQKNKLSRKLGSDGDYEMHGTVGDYAEESRTSFKSKGEKEAEKLRNKQEAKQQNKKVKTNHNPAASAASIDNNSAASKGIESSEKKPSSSGSSELSAGMDTTAVADAEKRVNSRIRKRTKTRSKQKNIRKDNRSDVHKPAHLVVTNKDYQGRPLTDKTKSILGV